MNDKFIKNMLKDLAVELLDEFDKNFERKAFFNVPWVASKMTNSRGSLMVRTSELRNSLRSDVSGNSIVFTSSRPDAALHNEGGEIIVTEAMKRYFWYRYYNSIGQVQQRQDGRDRNTKGNRSLKAEAEAFKAMALMKVGDKITVPQRQYIGYHADLDPVVDDAIQHNINLVFEDITKKLQQST
jgi:phage gpG-like protein